MNNVLTESKKDKYILENPNLTNSQKQEIIDFFNKYNNLQGLIKQWENFKNLTYNDFINIVYNRNTPKDTISSLVAGKDYDIIANDNNNVYYIVYTYRAAVVLASNNVAPEVWGELPNWYVDETYNKNWHKKREQDFPIRYATDGAIKFGGAKWCISMSHTDEFWYKYLTLGQSVAKYCFIFVMNTTTSKKFAVRLDTQATDYNSRFTTSIYDKDDLDENESQDKEEMTTIKKYLNELKRNESLDVYIKKFLDMLKQNLLTNPEYSEVNKKYIESNCPEGTYEVYQMMYKTTPNIIDLRERLTLLENNSEYDTMTLFYNLSPKEIKLIFSPEFVSKWVDIHSMFNIKYFKEISEITKKDLENPEYIQGEYLNFLTHALDESLTTVSFEAIRAFYSKLWGFLLKERNPLNILSGIIDIIYNSNTITFFSVSIFIHLVNEGCDELGIDGCFSIQKFFDCFVNSGYSSYEMNDIKYSNLADCPIRTYVKYRYKTNTYINDNYFLLKSAQDN